MAGSLSIEQYTIYYRLYTYFWLTFYNLNKKNTAKLFSRTV